LLKAGLDAAKEQDSTIGIAILDLDNFKHINDTYGHQVGDEVLRKSALRLVQSVRSDDAVCRIGGDEFLLIMKDCDSDTARETTERIRRNIVETPIPTRQGEITISTSVGFAIRNGTEDGSVDSLIERADQALLKSKSQGRDRVIEIA
jgi:diguanylate cyclase (GGDEF)-like protein